MDVPTGRICKKETLSFITTKHISTPLFYQISQTVDHSVSIKYRNALLITIKIISNFMHGSHSKSSRLINHSVYTGYTVFCAKQFLSGLRLPSQVQSTVTLWNFLPAQLRQLDLSLGELRRALKTHLFWWWLQRLVTFCFMALFVLYLLTLWLVPNYTTWQNVWTQGRTVGESWTRGPLIANIITTSEWVNKV